MMIYCVVAQCKLRLQAAFLFFSKYQSVSIVQVKQFGAKSFWSGNWIIGDYLSLAVFFKLKLY